MKRVELLPTPIFTEESICVAKASVSQILLTLRFLLCNYNFLMEWWIVTFTVCTLFKQMVFNFIQFSSVQLLSRVWLFATSMDWSTPGFSDNHQYLELAQNHVYQVSDAIQPSHPLLSPSPPAFNFPASGFFSNESILCIRWLSTEVSASASVLPMNIQDWFLWGLMCLISL